MAHFTVVYFIEEDRTMRDIERELNNQEGLLRAPLLAISPCTDFLPKRLACLTHAKAGKPDKPIELHELPAGGAIPTIPGKTLVCIGRCFVERTPLEVAAFR